MSGIDGRLSGGGGGTSLAAGVGGVLDCCGDVPAADEDLLARQSALQQEAGEVLAGLGLAALVADAGSLLVTACFVSGLMCWPEVDVTVHAGSDFSPADVMSLLAPIVSRPRVTLLD